MPTKSTDYKLVPITVVESGGGEQSDYSWDELAMIRHVKVSPKPEAPTINYFTAESNLGDVLYVGAMADITFKWEITGSVTDTTDISISGPVLGTTISGLGANGSRTVSVPITTASQPIFVLTACNGEECATASATNLRVTQPPPEIVYFQINGYTSSDSGGTPEYQIVFGEQIELAWSTNHATEVTLFFEADNLGNQYPEDILHEMADVQGVYRLQAANANGETDNAYLRVLLVPPAGLPGPNGLIGSGFPPTGPLTLTWNYNTDYEDYITGFRVYRRDASNNVMLVSGDLAKEDVLIGPGTYQWVDNEAVCDRVYYVEAYYQYPGASVHTADEFSEEYNFSCSP
jgi:hypothetical protein